MILLGYFMSRPKRTLNEQRDSRFTIRYTLAEAEVVTKRAMSARYNGVAPFIRDISLEREFTPAPAPMTDPALITELNRLAVELKTIRAEITAIGNNANQIARALNRQRPTPPELPVVLITIQELLSQRLDPALLSVEPALLKVLSSGRSADS